MKKQILAVDDDSSIRELLEFLLRNDYDVVTKKKRNGSYVMVILW